LHCLSLNPKAYLLVGHSCFISERCINFSCYNRIKCGNADKSLALSTSQCCRTELIVSLERGDCSCAELQVFSCNRGWKEASWVTWANFNNIDTWAVVNFVFPARQGAKGNSRHSDRNVRGTCTIVCHSLKVVIFPPVMCLIMDDPKQWSPSGIIEQIHKLNLEDFWIWLN